MIFQQRLGKDREYYSSIPNLWLFSYCCFGPTLVSSPCTIPLAKTDKHTEAKPKISNKWRVEPKFSVHLKPPSLQNPTTSNEKMRHIQVSTGWVPHCVCEAAEMRQAAPGTSPPSVSSKSFIFHPPFLVLSLLAFQG